MRPDLSERQQAVKKKLSTDLTFGDAKQCFIGRLDKLELTELHTHESYLRVNVVVTAQASASLPCASKL